VSFKIVPAVKISDRKSSENKNKYLKYGLNQYSNPSSNILFKTKYLKYDLSENLNPSLDTYKRKYLKYKAKYIKLKEKLSKKIDL
jgi:hypothetical protein